MHNLGTGHLHIRSIALGCKVVAGTVVVCYLWLRKYQNGESNMSKEIVKHRKDEKKKPTLTMKEKKLKKQEKKQQKKTSYPS